MTPPTRLDPIAAQLSLCACQSVILRAAQILGARRINDEQAAGFIVLGADEVLCHDDEKTTASFDEQLSYERWQLCRVVFGSNACADQLTLQDCIRWLTGRTDEDEDCVSYEEVMAMVLNG